MFRELEPGWSGVLASELTKPYILELKRFLQEEEKAYRIFPPANQIFAAFDATPWDRVKVVILGQDPYHQEGQAHGLAFSIASGKAVPPSLRNIYKELHADVPGFKIPLHGHLIQWAHQGVLLLNTTLTVREHQAGSHQKKGWEFFTDAVIRVLSTEKTGLVFLLWGRSAQGKSALIDARKHLVLTAAHPSPLSAHLGFLGCRHFTKTNAYLRSQGLEPIQWQV